MAAASRATMSSGWRSAQPRLRPYAARTVSKISSLRRWRTLFSCCFRRRAHIIGVSVRDTTSDSRIAADSVSANSRNRRPTMSPMNRIGMKTDRKSTRLNSSHGYISYAVSGLKKKNEGNAHFGRHIGGAVEEVLHLRPQLSRLCVGVHHRRPALQHLQRLPHCLLLIRSGIELV